MIYKKKTKENLNSRKTAQAIRDLKIFLAYIYAAEIKVCNANQVLEAVYLLSIIYSVILDYVTSYI